MSAIIRKLETRRIQLIMLNPTRKGAFTKSKGVIRKADIRMALAGVGSPWNSSDADVRLNLANRRAEKGTINSGIIVMNEGFSIGDEIYENIARAGTVPNETISAKESSCMPNSD